MEDKNIEYIEYAVAGLFSAIARLDKALEEENETDEITSAIIKTLYNNAQLIENYLYE